MITVDDERPQAIPTPCKQTSIPTLDMPTDIHPALKPTLEEFKSLFSLELGRTNTTQHVIDTGNALPIQVPPAQSHSTTLSESTSSYRRWPMKESYNLVLAHGVLLLYTYPNPPKKSEHV